MVRKRIPKKKPNFKALITITIIFVLMAVALVFQSTRKIFNSKAASDNGPLTNNWTLSNVHALELLVAKMDLFKNDPLMAKFDTGVFPMISDSSTLKSFYFQENKALYPNISHDQKILDLYGYDSNGDGKYELPAQNFCHLALFANLIKILGYETRFISDSRIKYPELKGMTLPEIIYLRYYIYYAGADVTPQNKYRTRYANYKSLPRSAIVTRAGSILTPGFFSVLDSILKEISSYSNNANTFYVRDIYGKYGTLLGNTASHKLYQEAASRIMDQTGKGNVVIVRAGLNGYRYSRPDNSTFQADHYMLIADARRKENLRTKYYPNYFDYQFFMIDSLGPHYQSDSEHITASSETGLGYIGWAGLNYFAINGERNKLIQDYAYREPTGIYDIVSVELNRDIKRIHLNY